MCQKKSGSGANQVSKCTYHDQLTFLDGVKESLTESNFDLTEESAINEEDDSATASALNIDKNDFKRKRPLKRSEFENNLLKLLEDSKDK